ncbi:uncharacterized protein [Branchiostoma lanceolatum]|uniref:uncharacterized protein n=1 Tax=Branchiostoma lanceolatum TaxID=7740 RepID=UPI003455D2FE
MAAVRHGGEESRPQNDEIPATSDSNAATNTPKRPGTTDVGPECAKVGITPAVLQNGWREDQERVPITNMIVAEIEAYREKRPEATQATAKEWLEKLLGPGSLDGVNLSSLATAMKRNKEKMSKARKNRTAALLEELSLPYRPPVPRETNNPEPSTSGMSQTLQAARQAKNTLQRQVKEKDLEIKDITIKNSCLERELKTRDKQKEKEEKKMRKKMKFLQEKEEKVRQKAITLNVKSWQEKVKRRDGKISNQQQRLELLSENSKSMKKKLTDLKKGKGNEIRQLQYWMSRSQKLEEELKAMKKKEKARDRQVATLQAEVEDLVQQVFENQRSINLREGSYKNSSFSDDLRRCFMDLLRFEVNAHQLSNVAHCVLTTLGCFDIDRTDFPGETFCQEMRYEANLVASIHVSDKLSAVSTAALQSDGTSRDGQKVVGMQVNTGGLTSTVGLQQVSSGVAEDQLDAFKFTFKKMAELTSSPEDAEEKYNLLVSTLKNTMGDGAASQKRFNNLLEDYRTEILPKVKENWDSLSTVQQDSLSKMNHMYCNLHALIGFATYADAGLVELEKVWREKEGPLGAEGVQDFQDSQGNYTWKHSDSATQRCIRTTSDAFAPGGNQQAGRILAFKDFLHIVRSAEDVDVAQKKKNIVKLKAFRANRFNIVFEAAAATYFHKDHIQKMFAEGFVKADNKLLKAVLADSSCQPLLAGCRALGIVNVQITKPYWALIEMKHVHILDLSSQLQIALTKFKQWMNDASPLLQPDMPPLFHTSHGPVQPIKDEVFQCLYHQTSDNMTTMTKQALEVILANMIVVLERRFPEQLYGTYSNSNDAKLREEMEGMEKSNRRGENDFGYWSYIISTKPSISLMAAEGQMMYKSNNTTEWLSNLSNNNPVRYRAILSLVRKQKHVWKEKYDERHKKQQEEREEHLHARAADHAKAVQKKEDMQEKKRKVLEMHGGPALTPADCDEFITNLSALPSNKQKTILGTHITYLKEKYPAISKPKPNRNMFALSSGGDGFDEKKLSANLRSIVALPEFLTQSQPPTEQTQQATVPAQHVQQQMTNDDMADKVSRIKAGAVMRATKCSKQPKKDDTERPVEGNETPAKDRESRNGDGSDQESDGEERYGEESDGEERGDGGESDGKESDGGVRDGGESDGGESNEEESDGEGGGEPPAKRKRLSDKDEKDEEDIVNGTMIVVAYEDDWALGTVEEVQDDGEIVVTYMQRKKSKKGKCTFFWPSRECVYTVKPKFILCTMATSSLMPNKDTLGRDSVIPEDDFVKIERKYNAYYNRYFIQRQDRGRTSS